MLDYYFSLIREERRDVARQQLHVLEVPDASGRAIAAKLLDRPDLIDGLRRRIGGRTAFIEPWNVTDDEVAVARAARRADQRLVAAAVAARLQERGSASVP